ncbi:MAG: transglutaminase-like domain-containing protein [Chloroflexota bacterium]
MAKPSTFFKQFAHESAKPDAAPERLALFIAGMAYPDLNLEEPLLLLDRMAQRVAETVIQYSPGMDRAIQFLAIINHEFAFEGNRNSYYDVQNNFLNVVLEKRTGMPISLSVICMAVGRRLSAYGIDLKIDGVGLPRHFMARYEDEAGVWLLDPFNGEVITENDAGRYLGQMLYDERWDGTEIALPSEVFRPVSPNMVAFRMLNNLRIEYLHQENLLSAIRVLDYMLVLQPQDELLWRERALLHYQCENWELAERDIRRFFFLKDSLLVTFTHLIEENDHFDELMEDLGEEDHNLLYLLSDIEKHRTRLN